jgi:hypothetical protein
MYQQATRRIRLVRTMGHRVHRIDSSTIQRPFACRFAELTRCCSVKMFPRGALLPVSYDETGLISPVAMCTAQVLYRGTRDRVEEEEPNQHNIGMHEHVWDEATSSKREVVSPEPAALACS